MILKLRKKTTAFTTNSFFHS